MKLSIRYVALFFLFLFMLSRASYAAPVKYERGVIYYSTNLYLFDDTNTPLHLRLQAIPGATNTAPLDSFRYVSNLFASIYMQRIDSNALRLVALETSARQTSEVQNAYAFAAYENSDGLHTVYQAVSNVMAAAASIYKNLGMGNTWRYGIIDLWDHVTGRTSYYVRVAAASNGLRVAKGVGSSTYNTVLDTENFPVAATNLQLLNAPYLTTNLSPPLYTSPLVLRGFDRPDGSGSDGQDIFLRGGYNGVGGYGDVYIGEFGGEGRVYLRSSFAVVITNGQYHGDGTLVSNVSSKTVQGYYPSDFVFAANMASYLKEVRVTPASPTSAGTHNTYIVTNGFCYLCNTNGAFGVGTNWNRFATSGW